jgi:hypothetical protein
MFDGPASKGRDCLCDDPDDADDGVDVCFCLVDDHGAFLRGRVVARVGNVGVLDDAGEGAHEFVVLVCFDVGAACVTHVDHPRVPRAHEDAPSGPEHGACARDTFFVEDGCPCVVEFFEGDYFL